ncbi:hypothetical protein DOS84_12390 [Flavobacterium aquariorum]|uniref:Uncharacterized protein n=1 Tax=Flavobacterium aquariorum TaxID=2217670 RepID=A0A2W7TSE3_9FLAO|nr:hypothetical protein [Flavobacterium aquariorum]PZX93151.1 hypothetical protein DOS84_12390 [Flavobacterium aquariorum]
MVTIIYAKASDYHIGAFAKFISIDQKDAALKPKNISMEQAASILLVELTACKVLMGRAKITHGKKKNLYSGWLRLKSYFTFVYKTAPCIGSRMDIIWIINCFIESRLCFLAF